jgi:hypothetical protein
MGEGEEDRERGRRRVREREIFIKKLEEGEEQGEEQWQWGRTFKKGRWERERKSGREGELEGERGRIWKPKTKRKWMRERARNNIDSKEL